MFLVGATMVYLLLATIWDLKDRAIYTFPCNVLTVMWIAYAFMQRMVDAKVVVAYLFFVGALYVLFLVTKIWGAGDSDLFLLFAAVYLAYMEGAITVVVVSAQCIALTLVLLISAIIGLIESRLRKKPFRRDSSIAIAPGYAVVMIGVMIGGLIA